MTVQGDKALRCRAKSVQWSDNATRPYIDATGNKYRQAVYNTKYKLFSACYSWSLQAGERWRKNAWEAVLCSKWWYRCCVDQSSLLVMRACWPHVFLRDLGHCAVQWRIVLVFYHLNLGFLQHKCEGEADGSVCFHIFGLTFNSLSIVKFHSLRVKVLHCILKCLHVCLNIFPHLMTCSPRESIENSSFVISFILFTHFQY